MEHCVCLRDVDMYAIHPVCFPRHDIVPIYMYTDMQLCRAFPCQDTFHDNTVTVQSGEAVLAWCLPERTITTLLQLAHYLRDLLAPSQESDLF